MTSSLYSALKNPSNSSFPKISVGPSPTFGVLLFGKEEKMSYITYDTHCISFSSVS